MLCGKTRGYLHHPQLDRFRVRRDPVAALDCYLSRVFDEARERGYEFDASKISYRRCRHRSVPVTAGQLEHEWKHLLGKLEVRAPSQWRAQRKEKPVQHGCFRVVPGRVAGWEKT